MIDKDPHLITSVIVRHVSRKTETISPLPVNFMNAA